MGTKIHQRSFGGGEIAPSILGRVDLNHYQTGLAKCLNFYPLPSGPAVNRPGFQFIKECKDGGTSAVRMIPFIFNTEQSYSLEFGDSYLRIHTEGGTVLEANKTVSGATQANPCVVTATSHGFLDGEEVYISSVVGMTDLNGRYFKIKNKTTNTFELTDLQGNNINSTGYTAYGSAGTAARVYTVTSPFTAAHLFDINYEQSSDVLTLVHPSYAPRELRRLGATNWTFTTITFAPSIAAPGGVSVSASPSSGTTVNKYVVTAVEETILEESVASAEVTATNDLSVGTNKNTVSWSAVSGATRYNIYKDKNGVHGYIGQTPDTSFDDDNITPDLLTSPPENQTPFTGSDNYPATVSYHDQRRAFSATNNHPQTTWMTRGGTESNISKSIPSQDDDSLQFSLASRQFNRIRNLVALDDLIIFTAAAEWKLYTQNSDALTPGTLGLRPQSYVGSSAIRPIVSGDAILFLAAQGGHCYDMNYSFETDKYKPRDISIVAPHLFDSYTTVDWGYSSVPHSIIWMIRSDGKMVGLTYLSGQKPDVLGWHQHETDGEFESVAVIPESSDEQMTYAVIKRRINGVDRRFIERLHSRQFTDVRDAFFVDCGLTHDDPKTVTAATQANPVVITSASHGFSNGDVIQMSDFSGLGAEAGMTDLNGNRYTVASVTTNTFELQSTAATPVNVNGTSFGAYITGGKARKEITLVEGLHHLVGESVAIFADGSVSPSQTVTAAGTITLPQAAARIHVGLPYTCDLKTLPLVFPKAEALGQGTIKSVTKAFIRVERSRGIFVGPDFDHLTEFAQRTNEDYGDPTRDVSEEIEITLEPNWSTSGQVAIRESDPVPISILSMAVEVTFGT